LPHACPTCVNYLLILIYRPKFNDQGKNIVRYSVIRQMLKRILRRVMIWPKKASKIHFHDSIVRANKRGVNDFLSGRPLARAGRQSEFGSLSPQTSAWELFQAFSVFSGRTRRGGSFGPAHRQYRTSTGLVQDCRAHYEGIGYPEWGNPGSISNLRARSTGFSEYGFLIIA
jgi:hypothetical protein